MLTLNVKFIDGGGGGGSFNERSNDGSPHAIEFRYYSSSLLLTTRIDILLLHYDVLESESETLVDCGVHAPISHLQIIMIIKGEEPKL